MKFEGAWIDLHCDACKAEATTKARRKKGQERVTALPGTGEQYFADTLTEALALARAEGWTIRAESAGEDRDLCPKHTEARHANNG